MSIARSLLIRASRSPWLAEQFRRRSFARRAVSRFMPGEDVSAALGAASTFAARGFGTLLTNLGERVTTRGEAAAVREHYLRVLESIAEQRLPTQLSVKLTHLGLDGDAEACTRDVLTLAARAEETGSFLWIDMEESHYVDATLEVFRRARAEHEQVGLCLQAYLHRTPTDLDALLPLSPAIRLVKGAYREPPEVAFPKKRDTDAQYLALAGTLIREAAAGRGLPVFGTHDMDLIAQIRRDADGRRAPRSSYEFHMLYGIRAADQRDLLASGAVVRVLISYGTAWFPWYMRRLAERPANVWFVVKSLVQ